MSLNTDLILAQEFEWITRNEPTFRINGNQFTGKVGRTPDGEDIMISISVAEYYPIVRPEVTVIANIQHPNIDADKTLNLQMLDMWEPSYRVKDIIASTRRLFVKSGKSIRPLAVQHSASVSSPVEQEITLVQQQIADYNRKINDLKASKLKSAGVSSFAVGSMKISRKLDLECQLLALNELILLLEDKFEGADIDQTDFFRLYRKYTKEMYMQNAELKELTGENYDYVEKTKRPITN